MLTTSWHAADGPKLHDQAVMLCKRFAGDSRHRWLAIMDSQVWEGWADPTAP